MVQKKQSRSVMCVRACVLCACCVRACCVRACCVLCAVSGILSEMIKCGGSCLQDSLMQLARSVVNTGSVTQAWANLFPRKVT